jgi:hypothetical protein
MRALVCSPRTEDASFAELGAESRGLIEWGSEYQGESGTHGGGSFTAAVLPRRTRAAGKKPRRKFTLIKRRCSATAVKLKPIR